jgi:putative PIN family toxin of toxin-antitoxin system
MRFAFDTNVLVSALLIKNSIPAQALNHAETLGEIVYSEACLHEIAEVLSRPKLQKYISADDTAGFLARIHRSWREIPILQRIEACRDPKDDKFLELALNAEVSVLITGDKDLLDMRPFQTINIMTPAEFLSETQST